MAQETQTPSTDDLGATSRESVSLETMDDDAALAKWSEGFGDDTSAPPLDPNRTDPVEPPEGVEEGSDVEQRVDEEGEADQEEQEGDEAPAEFAEAPEFWSAEDKAAWASVPPALRPLLHKIDKQRVAFEQEKGREAAKVRQEALEQVKAATGVVEEGAKWWQANGPQFFKAFGDKWAGVNWVELAEKDPAECQRLRMMQEQEAGLLRQAHERGQRDIAEANKRQQTQIMEARRSEHEKLATKLPEFFGTPEKSGKTYQDLAKFLVDKGIPPERVNNTYEAPIIELALAAMRFEQAKKQASGVVSQRDTKTGQFTAKTAPTRVQPGPGRVSGDRQAELDRQAMKQLRDSRGTDESAALRVFRNLA